jgi:hypothetical protein
MILFCNLLLIKPLNLGGMDVCDKVATMLQCGKDNSPEAVAGLMENLEQTLTVWQFLTEKCVSKYYFSGAAYCKATC